MSYIIVFKPLYPIIMTCGPFWPVGIISEVSLISETIVHLQKLFFLSENVGIYTYVIHTELKLDWYFRQFILHVGKWP